MMKRRAIQLVVALAVEVFAIVWVYLPWPASSRSFRTITVTGQM